jgi:hypothetical protein
LVFILTAILAFSCKYLELNSGDAVVAEVTGKNYMNQRYARLSLQELPRQTVLKCLNSMLTDGLLNTSC